MISVEVNLLSVLVAAVAGMAIGAYWYSPAGFGKQWQKLSGVTDAAMQSAKNRGMNKTYAIAFLGQLVMAYVLAQVIGAFQASGLMEGIQVGICAWLGFIATSMLGIVLWEGKPTKLYVLNAGYYVVVLAVMGAILAAWK